MFYRNKKEFIENKIKHSDVVLDVGFWGQGTTIDSVNWTHRFLLKKAKKVMGLDCDFDYQKLDNKQNYKKGNAEDFDFGITFDVIFVGDLIEHLSNPGLFLKCCYENLGENGVLVLTTPNCFNLFNIAEKFSKREPTVNRDHICYFNSKTLQVLLSRYHFSIKEMGGIYSLEPNFKESFKKKALNLLYWMISRFSDKFIETLFVVAEKEKKI